MSNLLTVVTETAVLRQMAAFCPANKWGKCGTLAGADRRLFN
jgi:hypothetical protein